LYEADGVTRRLESSITELRGIRRARVDLEDKVIQAVRVLIIPERSSREVIAEIRNVIHRLGYRVDPSVIQVLKTSESSPTSIRRRKLSSIATERTADRFKARVVLELGGDVLIGEDDSPSEKTFEHRSIARATLESVRELLVHPVDLGSVDVLQAGATQFAVVTLNRNGSTLVGSALIRVDHHDAIARATLDALNRSLTAP
jgi:hypothetical protein